MRSQSCSEEGLIQVNYKLNNWISAIDFTFLTQKSFKFTFSPFSCIHLFWGGTKEYSEKSLAFGIDRPACESYFCNFVAVWHWESYLISLCLLCLLYKMGMWVPILYRVPIFHSFLTLWVRKTSLTELFSGLQSWYR